MLGMAIIPHALPSSSMVLISTLPLKEVIEAFLQLVSPEFSHPYHLLPFLIGTVILFITRKGEGWNSPK